MWSTILDLFWIDIEFPFFRLTSNLDMNIVHFQNYGKNFVKQFKMSPDSYIQMAMQYAFYK